jgi:hypothetical protein
MQRTELKSIREVFLLVIEARKRNEHIFQEKKLAKTTMQGEKNFKNKNIF